MKSNAKGFSLIELLIAIALIAILATIAFPSFIEWRRNMEYKEAARDIASILRDARQRAINTNREHRVEFDVPGRQYRMAKGDRATESTDWSTVIKNWSSLPERVNMRRNDNCDNNTNVNVEFNPNGTGTSQSICIMDANNTRKYKIVVTSTTGRVRVE